MKVVKEKESKVPYLKLLKNDKEKEHGDGNLNLVVGKYLLRQGKFDSALEYYEKNVGTKFENSELFIDMAYCFCGLKKYEKAVESYNLALSYGPESAKTYVAVGYAYNYINRYQEAKHAFEKALELDPRCVEARLNMELLSIYENMAEAGERKIQVFVEPAKNDEQQNQNEIKMLQLPKKTIDEEENKCVNIREDSVNSDNKEGCESAAAEEKLIGQSQSNDPAEKYDSSDSLLALARSAFEEKNYLDAIAASSKVIELEGNHCEAHEILAKSLCLSGKKDESIEICGKLISFDKENIYGDIIYGMIYNMEDDYNKAINCLKKAFKKNPDNIEVNYYLGLAYCRKSLYYSAIPLLEKASKDKCKYHEANYLLSLCYEAKKEGSSKVDNLQQLNLSMA